MDSLGWLGRKDPAMAAIELDEKIPNNVALSQDRRLQRALENWQPKFLDWWQEMDIDPFLNGKFTCHLSAMMSSTLFILSLTLD